MTGAAVIFSRLGRQVQPLQKRCHAGFEYSGLDDPFRFSSERIHPSEAMAILHSVLEGVDYEPELPKLYRRKNSPNSVIFWTIEWFLFSFALVAECCFCL